MAFSFVVSAFIGALMNMIVSPVMAVVIAIIVGYYTKGLHALWEYLSVFLLPYLFNYQHPKQLAWLAARPA